MKMLPVLLLALTGCATTIDCQVREDDSVQYSKNAQFLSVIASPPLVVYLPSGITVEAESIDYFYDSRTVFIRENPLFRDGLE